MSRVGSSSTFTHDPMRVYRTSAVCSPTPLPSRVRNFPPPTLTHRCRVCSPLTAAIFCYMTCATTLPPDRSRRLSYATYRLSDKRHDEYLVYPITDLADMRCLHANNVVSDLISNKSSRRHRPIKFLSRVVGYKF